jgi:hypothetical protein
MIETFEDIQQGTDAWRQIRSGIPTSSEFATILAKGRSGGESKTRRTYLYKLAGERITGDPMESYSNIHMERGKVMEEEARSFYSFITDSDPQLIGFIRNGNVGCSPDSLLGTSGVLEIKTKLPHLMIELILKDEFPPDHRAQTQGQLMVAEREWVDICCYWPKMPPFIQRAYRDEKFIGELSRAVSDFNADLEALVERIRSYGGHDAIGEEAAA